jgi:RNA polymerase sigma factor (sigma-70 family)
MTEPAGIEIFGADRARLFAVAYRMLGSASDAEDVLQDAWLRYHGSSETAIRSPQAFATTIVTRLCLDRLKSARATREEYVGPWLPEPVMTTTATDREAPDVMATRTESVTLAFLVLLEALSPEERAVFILKEAFDYAHAEIGEMLGVTAEHSRQLLHRAKAALAAGRPTPRPTPERRREVAERFVEAFASGDATALTALLTSDVGMWSDGGGKASAARRPLFGRTEVLNFLVGVYRTAANSGRAAQITRRMAEVNGEPALLIGVAGELQSVFVFSVDGDAVSHIRVIRNPDKLAFIDRQQQPVI